EDRRFLSGLVAQGKGLPSNTSARFVVTHGPAHGFLHEAECVQHVGFSRGVGTEDPGDRQRLPVRFFWGRVIVDGCEEDLLLVTDGLVVLHAKTQQHGVLFPRNQEASSLSSRKNHTGNIPSPS